MADQHQDRVDPAAILPTVDWRSTVEQLVTAGVADGAGARGSGESDAAEAG